MYGGGAANYSKALPHDSRGEPLRDSYSKFVSPLKDGTFASIEAIPLGGELKLSNPLAQSAFELEGMDSCQFVIPAPPACGGSRQAAEMAELYWQAIARDVPFSRSRLLLTLHL